MKTLITVVACLFSITVFSQTKLISFRSHSGSNTNFRKAVDKNMFDIGHSNFGIVERETIDSVIMESKNRIIVVRNIYPMHEDRRLDTLTSANASEVFKATNMIDLKAALYKKYSKIFSAHAHYVGFNKKFKQNNTPKKK